MTDRDELAQSGQLRSAPLARRALSRARRCLVVMAREPVVHFCVLGVLFAVATGYVRQDRQRYVIHVGPEQQQRIAAAYPREYGGSLSADKLRRLIDAYVREEIYLREGLDLHLDRNDEIVRRRVVQKYEFLETDLAVPPQPDADELARWFSVRQAHYASPPRVSFSQVYFSADRSGRQAARERAQGVLGELRSGHASRAAERGDDFPGPSDLSALSPQEAGRVFGTSELTDKLFSVPIGQWEGPYESGYGWHLIYVVRRDPGENPSLQSVHDRVLTDYMEEARARLNEHFYDALRARYTVIYDR